MTFGAPVGVSVVRLNPRQFKLALLETQGLAGPSNISQEKASNFYSDSSALKIPQVMDSETSLIKSDFSERHMR